MTFWHIGIHHAFNDSQINNLFVKKNIVLRIIAIVLSFEIDGDVSLIWSYTYRFLQKKTELGSFVSASTFFLMAEQDGFSVPWNGWKFSLTHFPTIYRSDLGICPNRLRTKDRIRKCWPQPKIGDLLTSDDLLVWFVCIIWYVIFRGLQNTYFEWWTAMTERF